MRAVSAMGVVLFVPASDARALRQQMHHRTIIQQLLSGPRVGALLVQQLNATADTKGNSAGCVGACEAMAAAINGPHSSTTIIVAGCERRLHHPLLVP